MALKANQSIAVQTIHYATPFVVFAYFVCASIFSACMLRKTKSSISRRKKVAFVMLHAATVLGYVGEGLVIITQIFASSGKFASKDYNIFVLSQSLVWTVLTAFVLESKRNEWYPYSGAWILSLISEVIVIPLALTTEKPSTLAEWAQVTLQLFRICCILCLLAICFSHYEQPVLINEEETDPLLAKPDESKQKSSTSLGFDIADADASMFSDIADDEAEERDREEKERIDKLNSRLEEEGNWFNYLKGFLVFFPHIWPSKRPLLFLNMIVVGACLLVARCLIILEPRQLGIVVNKLGEKDEGTFTALGLYVFLSWLNSYSGIEGLRDRFWFPIEAHATASLDAASYDTIMDLSCDFHDEKQSGELYTAMSQGKSLVNLLSTLLIHFLPILVDLFLALAYFYILFDSYLVLIGAATVVFYCWASVYLATLQIKVQRKENASIRRNFQVMYATMGEWKTVTYFNRIPHAKKLYTASINFWQKIWIRLNFLIDLSWGLGDTILDIGSFVAFFYAVYNVIYGGKNVGTFVTLVNYWHSFTNPIISLARMHQDVLHNLVDAEELLAVYRKVPSIQDGPNELQITDATVVFENISFDYSGKKNVIKDISFTAESGKTIALIGETGSGKSTLLKLLFRFYDVQEGAIYIDGQDIRDVTLESLREQVGVVPQDASLFNDTIMSNVRYARLEAKDEEIFDACKAAAIHDKIMSFPEGYRSKVGEKGVKLSGGELQRIAIARAILKNPKIILLDEATSSVDNDTELKIQEGLKKLCKGRTTFVVAHRLSTIMEADLILVVKDGSIVEQGAPADLLKQQGKYYHLWSKQVGLFDAMRKADNSDTAIDTSPALSSHGDDDKSKLSDTESKSSSELKSSRSREQTSKKPRRRARSNALESASRNTYGTIESPSAPTQNSGYESSDSQPDTSDLSRRRKSNRSAASRLDVSSSGDASRQSSGSAYPRPETTHRQRPARSHRDGSSETAVQSEDTGPSEPGSGWTSEYADVWGGNADISSAATGDLADPFGENRNGRSPGM